MRKFAIIASVVLLVLSCQDIENCLADNNRDFMILAFFDKETKTAKKVGFTVTADESPFRFQLADDSTFIGLPLNPDNKNTTYFFRSDTSLYELEMTYDEVQVSIFDPKCNPSITFIGLDTVRYTFDSLSVPGTITNRQLDTNVEVFF